MNREEALIEARKLYGDLGMIGSGEELPRLVWKIGEPETTIGRGWTWEKALASSKRRHERAQRKVAKVG